MAGLSKNRELYRDQNQKKDDEMIAMRREIKRLRKEKSLYDMIMKLPNNIRGLPAHESRGMATSSSHTCPLCPKTFSGFGFLQGHMERRHKDQYDPSVFLVDNIGSTPKISNPILLNETNPAILELKQLRENLLAESEKIKASEFQMKQRLEEALQKEKDMISQREKLKDQTDKEMRDFKMKIEREINNHKSSTMDEEEIKIQMKKAIEMNESRKEAAGPSWKEIQEVEKKMRDQLEMQDRRHQEQIEELKRLSDEQRAVDRLNSKRSLQESKEKQKEVAPKRQLQSNNSKRITTIQKPIEKDVSNYTNDVIEEVDIGNSDEEGNREDSEEDEDILMDGEIPEAGIFYPMRDRPHIKSIFPQSQEDIDRARIIINTMLEEELFSRGINEYSDRLSTSEFEDQMIHLEEYREKIGINQMETARVEAMTDLEGAMSNISERKFDLRSSQQLFKSESRIRNELMASFPKRKIETDTLSGSMRSSKKFGNSFKFSDSNLTEINVS
eukprot:TRINITY_DN3418_c0_g1_i1.p1 TRINITY_DN3418_c0_g1~~TRINITY_DN3418_c0_g1_i1.p1  ORF type:complete len:554 (+),score=154.21 TRINITY_DN3418_c0_g1_i1:160-1662(+)